MTNIKSQKQHLNGRPKGQYILNWSSSLHLHYCYLSSSYHHLASRTEYIFALAGVAQLVGALSPRLQGCGFDTWAGHMPRLWVPYLVEVHTRRQPIHASILHQYLSPSSLSKTAMKKPSLGENKKKPPPTITKRKPNHMVK